MKLKLSQFVPRERRRSKKEFKSLSKPQMTIIMRSKMVYDYIQDYALIALSGRYSSVFQGIDETKEEVVDSCLFDGYIACINILSDLNIIKYKMGDKVVSPKLELEVKNLLKSRIDRAKKFSKFKAPKKRYEKIIKEKIKDWADPGSVKRSVK